MPIPDDTRSYREIFIGRAQYAACQPEPERRRTATGLIYERNHGRTITDGVLGAAVEPTYSVEDVFNYIYGDVTGRSYWHAYLFLRKLDTDDLTRADELARLLAKHAGAGEFERVRKRIAESVAAIADQPARAMVEHLIADPDASRFVPETLRAFLEDEPAEPPMRTRASSSAPAIPFKVGPSPVEFDRVVAAMRKSIADGVDVLGTKNVRLEVMFGAKRTTTWEAKKFLAEEIAAGVAGVTGPATPINDKWRQPPRVGTVHSFQQVKQERIWKPE